MRGIVKGGLNDGGAGSGMPNLHDWSAYNTLHNWSGNLTAIPASTSTVMLNISGEGYLVFARAGSQSVVGANPDMVIEVDGQTHLFEGSVQGSQFQGNSLFQPIYFKNSLKITVINPSTGSRNYFLDYTCLVKSDSPGELQTLLTSTNRKMVFTSTTNTTNTTAVNINGSGYLLAVEFSNHYGTANGTSNGNITIDTVSVMNNRTVKSANQAGPWIGPFIGPIRFESNLTVEHAAQSGVTSLVKVWYTLD